MADLRTSFMVLEDSGSQAGVPLHKALEGDAIAAKNAQGALVAKNGANFAYLKVDPTTGALITTNEGAGICNRAKGELSAGSATLATVTGALITLVAGSVYNEIDFIFASRRDSLFQIVWDDGGVETILAEVIVGSGAYTVSSQLHCVSFTAGATGVQQLKIFAKNFEALSSLRASITANQVL